MLNWNWVLIIDYKINLLVIKNRAKLEKLIENNASSKKILKQSQLLDKYIAKQIKEINNIK